MITDEWPPIDLSDFWEEDEDTELPEFTARTGGVDPDYIQRHIDRIPHYGDDSRYRLASHLDMFENLNVDGTLTPEQREAVDNFAIGWQAADVEESQKDEMDFPECQYVAVGLDLGSVIELGDSWRRGEWLPDVGHPAADRVTNRLNQMQNRRDALQK